MHFVIITIIMIMVAEGLAQKIEKRSTVHVGTRYTADTSCLTPSNRVSSPVSVIFASVPCKGQNHGE